MTTARRYSRAPIAEAIIDIQVELPEDIGLPAFERCQDPAYPGKKAMTMTVRQFELGEAISTSSTSASSKQVGFLFTSADQRHIFQAHCNGFTVNRLAPYDGWEPFRDEARRLWGVYRQQTRPRKITRVAVRYINRIDLPSPVVELKDYLRTSPEVSPDMPQVLAGFFMQLTIPQKDIESTLVLTQANIPPPSPEAVSVILDIDLSSSGEIPSNDGEIWAFAERLRARKNEIFEACITDRTREMIQ